MINRVSIRKTLVEFLRNFCGTKRKFFLSLRISFVQKSSNLRNHLQKAFRLKLPYSAFAQLKFCAILLKHMCVFLGIARFLAVILNSGKILFWNVLLLVTFTYLTNDSQDEF